MLPYVPTIFLLFRSNLATVDAGIINVVRCAKATFPSRPIHMIIGGLHLAGPELAYRLKPTVDALVDFDPDYVVPLHCTGFDAKVLLREKLGQKVVPGGVGMVINVDKAK